MAIKTSDLYKDEGTLLELIDQLHKVGDTYEKTMEKMHGQSIKIEASVDKFNATTIESREQIEKQSESVNKLHKEWTKYSKLQGDVNQQIQGLKKSQRELNRVHRLEGQLASSKKGSYNQLSAQYSLNKIKLNQLTGAERKATVTGRELEKQTVEIYQEMKRLQEATGKHTLSVGDYAKANRGLLGTLKGLAAAYLSFEGIKRLGNVIFRQTRETDALNKAYEKIIPNSILLAENNEFLNDVAENYGTNLITLRKNNLRFNAATKSSNLSTKEKQKIFESLAKSSAALGLEATKVDRVFNAVEQIMSKGKVTSEELRQQLGDSLPGSLEIMARALGVNTLELDKMLKKGEVLAEDAMPKFAAQLEKTYGIENVKRIDNVVTAQGRFETAIIKTVEKLKAAKPLEDFFDLMTRGVTFIGDNIKAILNLSKGLAIAGSAWAGYRLSVISASTATNIATKAMAAFNAVAKANPIGLLISGAIAAASAYALFNDEIKEFITGQENIDSVLEKTNKSILKEQLTAKKLFETLTDVEQSTDNRINALNKLKELYPEYTGHITFETESLKDLETAQNNVTASIKNRLLEQRKAIELDKIFGKLIDKELKLEGIKDGSVTPFGGFLGLDPKQAKESLIKQTEKEIGELNKAFDDVNSKFDSFKTSVNVPAGGTKGSTTQITSDLSPFKIEQLKIDALQDGIFKELQQLELNQKKRQKTFNEHGLQDIDLTKKNEEERQKIIDKFQKIEAKKIGDQAKEIIKAKKQANLDGTNSIKQGLKEFEDLQKLEEAKFNVIKRSEIEKKRFKKKQEIEYIKFVLETNTELTDIQVSTLKNRILGIKNELSGLIEPGKKKTIWDILGIDVSEDQMEGLKTATQSAFDSLNGFMQKSIELSNVRVEASRAAVQSAENELQIQLQNRSLNHADSVETAQKELQLARKNQEDALSQQRKAQQQQIILDGILQSSNLITASTKIWSQLGFPFAIPALGVMWGSFIASKARAIELTKETRGEGGLDFIGGGTHASGNDTFLGYYVNGKPVYGEKNEAHMTLDAATTSHYKNDLPQLYASLKNRTFFDDYGNRTVTGPGAYRYNSNSTDMSTTNGYLKKMSESEKVFEIKKGTVIKKGNRTTRYV